MIIVVMGVSGSGKTTIGSMLADALGCEYLEGDSLHSAENVGAMSRGTPLSDADRMPWLDTVHARLRDAHRRGRSLVTACSALKQSYRERLSDGVPVRWVYLKGRSDLIEARLNQRTGHYATHQLLDSQMDTLEEPSNAIVIDITPAPEVIVDGIIRALTGGPDVRVSPDVSDMSLRAARAVATVISDVVDRNERCSLMLSGGATPRGLHRVLAEDHADLPWNRVHIFWSDERYVPPDHPLSNYRMAHETLLAHVACPPSNIHPMPTLHGDPADAARAYEETLARYFGPLLPVFDLAILGIGGDGHTASLFPRSKALREDERWVLAVTGEAEPPRRLTLTMPVLRASARSWFLVDGVSKADIMRRVLLDDPADDAVPAAAVHRSTGEVVWWLDADAASLLPHSICDAAD